MIPFDNKRLPVNRRISIKSINEFLQGICLFKQIEEIKPIIEEAKQKLLNKYAVIEDSFIVSIDELSDEDHDYDLAIVLKFQSLETDKEFQSRKDKYDKFIKSNEYSNKKYRLRTIKKT